ncbi:MAG: hypothetical protein IAC58_06225 [Firmicutes bacterium]|uniref:Hydrolase n=1 Tax=Candidatus Onthovivens merdipullorum TaxID=2840889 RepID=A0A9D9GX80_9BACL|nr:hypothetical protein [Candidatus Onthovivens merdipullorum]
MFKKELIDKVYAYSIKDDDSLMFKDVDNIYHNPFNEKEFKIYGSGIIDKEKSFHRFTSEDIKNIGNVSQDVMWLATHSSGIQIHFKTNSRLITLRVLENGVFDMKNLNFFAQCGFDLYYKEDGVYKFHNIAFPNYIDRKKFISNIGVFRETKEREIIINLPLYIGVESLEIGLEKDSYALPTYYKNNGKILCYGTSILQGCGASRPGLSITNVVSRFFDIDTLNYGFSGAGLLEKEVGSIIAKVDDVKLLIIDAEANAGCDKWMVNNFDDFINEFYKKYPNLAVILMNKSKMSIDSYLPRNKMMKVFNDKFLKSRVNKYRKLNKEIYFINNYDLFSKDEILDESEFTVDGVHPNDLGMTLLSKNYIKAIKNVKSLKLN